MGTSESVFRQPNPATATAREKHGKRPRLQSHSTQSSHDLVQSASRRTRKHKRRKPLGPGTRPGAHRDVPISIDSDDDDVSVVSLEAFADARSRAYNLPAIPVGSATLASASKNRASLSQAQHVQRKQDSAFYPQSPQDDIYHDKDSYEERLVSLEPATPIKSRKTARFHRLPAFPRSSARNDMLSASAPPTNSTSRASSFADDAIACTLADISDFDLRKKTAQLMAVAPGLPVADLYRLLMERNGRFEAAVKDAIRASQAPSNKITTIRETAPSRSATAPFEAPDWKQGKLVDESEIKIDFDDPVFTWDNDAPTTPPRKPQRRQQQGQKKPKTTATTQKIGPSKGHAKTAKTIQDTGASMKRTGTYVVPSSKRTGDINRGIRATSYDLEFIVPDDEISDESDNTYSDTDESIASEVDMTDDGTDLLIDMQPEFAYNSDVLGSP